MSRNPVSNDEGLTSQLLRIDAQPAPLVPSSDRRRDAIGSRVSRELRVVPPTSAAAGKGTARASVLYLALSIAFAMLAWGEQLRVDGLVLAGVLSFVALLSASVRLRSHRTASFTSWQRDPFLAFAAALAVLVAPHVVAAVDVGSSEALEPYGWLVSGLAAALAADEAAALSGVPDFTSHCPPPPEEDPFVLLGHELPVLSAEDIAASNAALAEAEARASEDAMADNAAITEAESTAAETPAETLASPEAPAAETPVAEEPPFEKPEGA